VLGTYVRPLYDTRWVSEPFRACYYITRVHIRVLDSKNRGFYTISSHESLTLLSTYATSVSNATRRALWSLSHTYRQQLQDTAYRHLHLRPCGSSQTSVVPGEAREDRLNTLMMWWQVLTPTWTVLPWISQGYMRSLKMLMQGLQHSKLNLKEEIQLKLNSMP
jgi:hypothetical protein